MFQAISSIFTACWEFVRGVKRCPYCNEKMLHLNDSVNGIYLCRPCMHPIDYFMPTISENESPALTIKRVQGDWDTLNQEHKALKHYLEKAEKDRHDAVILHQSEALDWNKACEELTENLKDLDLKVHAAEIEVQQRDVRIKGLEAEITRQHKHEEEVRLPLLEALRTDLAEARYTEEQLKSEILRQDKIINRLRSGDFTPEELQNLCHNFSDSEYSAFIDGCAEYQKKLFGKCDRDALKAEINHLRQILGLWDKAGEAAIRAYGIEHETARNPQELAKAGEKPPFQMVHQDADGKTVEVKPGQ